MSLLKYVDRMKRMDDLIRRRATGKAPEFAQKLGISVSVLKENLAEMRTLGAPIEYSRLRGSYCYKRECRLLLRFSGEVLSGEEQVEVRGGQGLLEEFPYCVAGHTSGMFRLLVSHSQTRMPKSE